MNAEVAVYLDSSALVKLVVVEAESIHLAAARALRHGLTEVITYDRRMAAAADRVGLPVAAPA